MNRAALILLLSLWTFLFGLATAQACAPAPPAGIEVDILGEDAVVVWDAEQKLQHFIRRADFHSRSLTELRGTGFGFLVPTPTRPELAEAPDAIFHGLAKAVAPERIKRKKYDVLWSLCNALRLSASDGAPAQASAVEVLETKRVAGYDAAVLKASDAEALGSWLDEHGYAFRPALKGWLEAYVQKQWIVTAFKIAIDDDSARSIGSSAVRMSFSTERPFFPYREPSDQGTAAPSRTFRLFVIAPERMDGVVGEDTAWPGQLLHAAPVDAAALLAEAGIPGYHPPDGAWLHAFIDRSSPRPGADDLWLSRSPEQVEKRLPPIIDYDRVTIPLFLDVVAFLLLIGWLSVRIVRRKRAA